MVVESLLSTNDMLLYIVLQFIVYFGPGYLLLQRQLNSIPFVIKLPLYFSVGMLVVTIILSVMGIFYIWDYSLIVVGTISYILIIMRLVLHNRESIIGKLVATVRSQFCLSSTISLLVFSFTVGIFVYISGYLKWPQPGDAVAHGFLTNLLVMNQVFQTTLAPVAPSLLWSSPFGFHIIAANLSLAFNIFPGASIFVSATTIMTLILMLIYSLTYILTRSVIFSLLALMSGLYVSSIPNLEYWLIGYYYNGIYPCIFGYLALFVYVTVQFAERYAHNMKTSTYWILSLISLAGAVMIYPPFAILPSIHFVATYIFKNGNKLRKAIFSHMGRSQINDQLQISATRTLTIERIIKKLSKRSLITYALFGVAAVLITIISAYILSAYWNSYINNILFQISYNISEMIFRVGHVSFQYALNPETFFMSDLDAPLTFLTMGVAGLAIVKRKYVYLSGSYLLFSIPLLLSMWDITANYFWFILPRRLFVFLIIFNWIMILTYARIFIDWMLRGLNTTIPSRNQTLKYNLMSYGIYVLIAIPPTILLVPDVISNAELIEADRWVGWYTRSETFRNDYDMIAWISENIDSNDLIMVQNSDTFSFIYSFAIKNVTSLVLGLPESQYNIQRAFDNQIAWDRPQLLKQFIDEYNVKYVLLLTAPDSWGYRNLAILGGDGLLHGQKYSVQSYDNIFSNMSFLEPIKTFGTSNLYEVVPKS